LNGWSLLRLTAHTMNGQDRRVTAAAGIASGPCDDERFCV